MKLAMVGAAGIAAAAAAYTWCGGIVGVAGLLAGVWLIYATGKMKI